MCEVGIWGTTVATIIVISAIGLLVWMAIDTARMVLRDRQLEDQERP